MYVYFKTYLISEKYVFWQFQTFIEYLFTFYFNKVVELSDRQGCRTFWSTLLF